VKINEIFGGASLGGIGKQLYKKVAGDTNYDADTKFAQGLQQKFKKQGWGGKPQPQAPVTPQAPEAPQAPQPAQSAQDQHWTTMPNGVQLSLATRAGNPTFARYNKQVYRLTPDDRWVDVRDKPVTQTMTSLLNQALGQT
jgi:hypothetical protein